MRIDVIRHLSSQNHFVNIFFKIVIAFCSDIAYNKYEPIGSQRVFRHPHPKCEALQQVFRHLYPKRGTLTIRGDVCPLVFSWREASIWMSDLEPSVFIISIPTI